MARNLLKRAILGESGLAGHLMHLTDNVDLTFGELFEVFSLAGENNLEKVVEKVDGQNIFFSFDVASGTVRFARNKGDLAKGGMTKGDIEAKWSSVPNVREAFGQAYDVLQDAVSTALSEEEKVELFGTDTNVWFNAEVVSTANPNVINYDRNVILPHEFGAIHISRSGAKEDSLSFDAAAAFAKLKSVLVRLQQLAAKHGWEVAEPIIINLTKNKDAVDRVVSSIRTEIMSPYGLQETDTIGDYLTKRVVEAGSMLGISEGLSTAVANRMLEKPDRVKNIKELQGMASTPQEAAAVTALDKSKDKLLKKVVRPLELVVNEFATEMLTNLQSALARNPSKTVDTMKTALNTAVKTLEQDPENVQFVKSQLEKLSGPLSSIEGVVFRYKGNSYKLTGNFSAINQLLGALRFRKSGGETILEESVNKTVGIYPGAFKPYHAGHDFMVREAATKVDQLILLVSAQDRVRPGEFPLMWKGGMEEVWKLIVPTLPDNVVVKFVTNPVTATFDTLKEVEQAAVLPAVVLVASEEDRKRFNDATLKRNAPKLSGEGKITIMAPERVGGFSGTKARQALMVNDLDGFAKNLPVALQPKAEEVFNTLITASNKVSEGVSLSPRKKLIKLLKEAAIKALTV